MISPGDFFRLLQANAINFYAGVPDSLLKDFCSILDSHAEPGCHFITAHEGSAVALAAGYHLATGQEALVYMQNSGIGNAVNPLLSLADPEVYGIPMLLLIGWRGEPGRADEPQHLKQGRVLLPLLESLEIPAEILPESLEAAATVLSGLLARMRKGSGPAALIVREGTFEPHRATVSSAQPYGLARETALKIILDSLKTDDIVVATTGKASREIYEYRAFCRTGHNRDFLTVGSMGHASQIALGIALKSPGRKVYCLDGDGAAIMHMGGLAVCGSSGPVNFKHIILNNGAHESVGGQPTAGFAIDFLQIAKGCGYRSCLRADSAATLSNALFSLAGSEGPALLEVRISAGSRPDLGRPKSSPLENKKQLMELLAQ